MCKWVSACSVGDGKLLWFPKAMRDQIVAGKLRAKDGGSVIDDPDSHSQICAYYGVNPDKANKYEFRPLDRKFIVDQVNTTRDAAQVEEKMRRINYRHIAPPELVFKPIVHPFRLPKRKPTPADIRLLKKWDSVGGSVMASVRASVWGSVWGLVGGSVRDSARDSVWDSVWAYAGSFFKLPRKSWLYTEKIPGRGYPFQSTVTLWERGLVPSFDGNLWRLHSGPNADIVWEGKLQ